MLKQTNILAATKQGELLGIITIEIANTNVMQCRVIKKYYRYIEIYTYICSLSLLLPLLSLPLSSSSSSYGPQGRGTFALWLQLVSYR